MPRYDPPLFGYQERTVTFGTRDQQDLLLELKDTEGSPVVQMAAAKKGRAILYVDPGLGKSRIALEIHHRLARDEPLLIIASKNAFNTWRREHIKWEYGTKDEITFVSGQPQQRQHLWRNPTRVMVATYKGAENDWSLVMSYMQATGVRFVIFDEAQRARNRKTKTYVFCKRLAQRIPYVLFLSGTFITRGPQDLFTYLHMCDPKRFKGFWKFANAFCNIIEGGYGREIVGAKNTKGLARELSRHLIRLRDKDPEVKSARPPLTRDMIPIEVDPKVKRIHDELLESLATIREDGSILISPNAATAIMQVRQLLVCPKIIDPSLGWGDSIDFILSEMEEDPHIVIFTPFRQGLEYMRQAIVETLGPHMEPFTLMGGNTPDDVQMVEREFNAPGEERPFIGTISFAESYELPTARRVFFNGFDWSQLRNYQAEERPHRLTTPHPINVYYLVGSDTIEEHVLEILNHKQRNTRITMQDYINVLRDYNKVKTR